MTDPLKRTPEAIREVLETVAGMEDVKIAKSLILMITIGTLVGDEATAQLIIDKIAQMVGDIRGAERLRIEREKGAKIAAGIKLDADV